MSQTSSPLSSSVSSLFVAPKQVLRGRGILAQAGDAIATYGKRPLLVGGDRSLAAIEPQWQSLCQQQAWEAERATYHPDCSESSLATLQAAVTRHQSDLIIGVGGGKPLDLSKLLAHRCQLPAIAIPTSAATCAAWSALSNVYDNAGAFQYDVALDRCPDLLILDYEIIETAPQRTLIAGIGDAIAKWYEASVSSGQSSETLVIAAVQQARVLRDLLFQKSAEAVRSPGGEDWQQVVDATVLLAGAIGGLGGAQCRTVAAHAVHNGLTQIRAARTTLHGEKVAYGILVQLRLEEMIQGNQLAATARQQLLQFYTSLGLPQTLEDLGLGQATLEELCQAADVACQPHSDLHRLPFSVSAEQLMAAMVSTRTSAIADGSQSTKSQERAECEL